MNSVVFSIDEKDQDKTSRNDFGYCLPATTEAAELAEKILLWPPAIRKAAIGFWCSEVGLHPSEFWDIAAALLASQSEEVML